MGIPSKKVSTCMVMSPTLRKSADGATNFLPPGLVSSLGYHPLEVVFVVKHMNIKTVIKIGKLDCAVFQTPTVNQRVVVSTFTYFIQC